MHQAQPVRSPGSARGRRGCRPRRPAPRRSRTPAGSRRARWRRRRSRRPGPARGPGLWRRCVGGLDRERAEDVLRRGLGQHGSGGSARGRTRAGPARSAATVVTVPASPTSVARVARHPGSSRATSARWSRTTDTACDSSSGAGGSECEELLGDPHAPDVDRDQSLGLARAEHELGRSTADVDDEVGAGASRARRSRRGTTARASSSPESSSGSTPSASRRGTEEVVAVRRRRAPRSSRWPARAVTPSSSIAPRYSRSTATVRSIASGCEPAGRVDPLAEARDAHPPVERCRPCRRAGRAVDVGDEQPDRVGPDVDRGDAPAHAGSPPDRCRDPRADRVVAAGEPVRVVGVQALHARPGCRPRHPTAADRRGRPGSRRRARRRRRRGRPRERVGVDLGLGRPHAAGGLEPGDAAVELGVDEPVAGRHRRAVAGERRVADDHGCAGASRTTTSNSACGSRPSSSVSVATSAGAAITTCSLRSDRHGARGRRGHRGRGGG